MLGVGAPHGQRSVPSPTVACVQKTNKTAPPLEGGHGAPGETGVRLAGGGARENPRRCGRSAVSGVGTKRGGGAGGGRSLPSPPSAPGRPWPGCMSVWSGGLPRSYTEPEELVAASPSPTGGHRVLARALDHRLSACRGHTGGLPSPAVPQAESRGKPPVTSASLCLRYLCVSGDPDRCTHARTPCHAPHSLIQGSPRAPVQTNSLSESPRQLGPVQKKSSGSRSNA